MSTNYVLPNSSILIVAILFIFSLVPFANTNAVISATCQSAAMQLENENAQSENEIDATNVKKEKKKDKTNKDDVQINENFFINLGIDLVTVFLLIFGVYYPSHKKIDKIFTFILFNVVIFLLTFVLNKVKISMGAAFGLFAVFSMLRYRTEGIDMKDMTYLFIFIALGLLSGIQMQYYELGIISAVIFVITLLFDSRIFIKRECVQLIMYENIELIKLENRDKLIADLKERTGLNIHRVVINEMNFLRDSADINVYYYE